MTSVVASVSQYCRRSLPDTSARLPAEAKTENVVVAKGAGVNNYIIKPFNLNVLKTKLSAVLGALP